MRSLHHDPEAVAEALRDSGINQTLLARRVGCSLSLISEILGGTRNADEQRLAAIAAALGCDVASLRAKPARRRPAPSSTSGDLLVRHEERAESGDVPEVRGAAVTGGGGR
jgi:transcriptional regulator with XRE-family HTH domain